MVLPSVEFAFPLDLSRRCQAARFLRDCGTVPAVSERNPGDTSTSVVW
jgi:hypothetical protein